MSEWRVCLRDSRLEVSAEGQVRNVRTGVMRKFSNGGKGYQLVCMGDVAHYVHHLVAEAFVGTRRKGQQVSHIDGNKTNNRADNLAIESPRANIQRKAGHGTQTRGSSHGTSRLSDVAVLAIRCWQGVRSARSLAEEAGVSQAQIYRIWRRENWSHL